MESWFSAIFATNPLVKLSIGIILSLILTRLILRWRSPLTKIPGPRLATYTRLWLWRTLASGHAEDTFARVHEEYGPVARIGPSHLIISDPETTRRILSPGTGYSRGPWFDTLKTDPQKGNLVSERDPEKHLRGRKIFNQSILEYGNERIEAVINHHITSWISKIAHEQFQKERHSSYLDLARSLSYLAVDITTHICLGEAFGCVASDRDEHGFLAMIRRNMAIQQFMSVFLECCTLIRYLAHTPARSIVVPTAGDGSDIGTILCVIKDSIHKSHNQGNQDKSLVSTCITRGLPPSQADKESLVLLSAGSDTTSTAAQGILLGIISNPRSYRILHDEIDTAIARGVIDSRIITDKQAKALPYFQACIREGLRLHQPLFQLRERVVPAGGDVILNYHVPEGTFVGLNAISTQRNVVFGEHLDAFLPERWIDVDPERKKHMLQTLELVFGYGPTKCLGSQIAMMELNKVVFELLRNFDISVVNPLKPWKRTSFGIFYQEDFFVHLTKRQSSQPLSSSSHSQVIPDKVV